MSTTNNETKDPTRVAAGLKGWALLQHLTALTREKKTLC